MEHLYPFTTEESARSCALEMGLVSYRIVIRHQPFLSATAGGGEEWIQNTHYFIDDGL